MTTIAYKAGMIAADTICTFGGTRVAGVTKIGRTPKNGSLAGAAGFAVFCSAFVAWVNGGENQKDRPTFASTDEGTDQGAILGD